MPKAPVRTVIIQALEDAEAIDHIKPSLLAAFECGEKDIPLNDLELDSLARMELLIALETEFDLVVTPEQFASFNSLGDLVVFQQTAATADSTASARPTVTEGVNNARDEERKLETATPVVRLFQRVFRICQTVAQLNKALASFEHRLTPLEFMALHDLHLRQQLFPKQVANKFEVALAIWFERIAGELELCGKSAPEPFVAKRVSGAALLFCGPGLASEKTLVVCFSGKGSRRLVMPHAVLLQHVDASRYDFLVLADPWDNSFRAGVPLLGRTIAEVSQWLLQQPWLSKYQQIRTFGFSAGSSPAVVAGYYLQAKLAVSVSGRFPSERHVGEILSKVFNICLAVLKGRCGRVLLSHTADKSRDRTFARCVAWLTGGNCFAVTMQGQKLGHFFLEDLRREGKLRPFLEQTLFADDHSELVTRRRLVLTKKYDASEKAR